MFLWKEGRGQRAQTFVEYTLLFGILAMLLIAMSPMVKRGVQGMVKTVADQLGNQQEADQEGGDKGYLVNSYTLSHSDTQKRVRESGSRTTYEFSDQTTTRGNVLTNLGFREH